MIDYKLVDLIMGLNLMKQSQDLTEDQKISIQTLEILADAIEKIGDLRRPKFKPAAIVGESGGEIVLPNIRKDRINFATDEQANQLRIKFEKMTLTGGRGMIDDEINKMIKEIQNTISDNI